MLQDFLTTKVSLTEITPLSRLISAPFFNRFISESSMATRCSGISAGSIRPADMQEAFVLEVAHPDQDGVYDR